MAKRIYCQKEEEFCMFMKTKGLRESINHLNTETNFIPTTLVTTNRFYHLEAMDYLTIIIY